jgi:hypothetical protein
MIVDFDFEFSSLPLSKHNLKWNLRQICPVKKFNMRRVLLLQIQKIITLTRRSYSDKETYIIDHCSK